MLARQQAGQVQQYGATVDGTDGGDRLSLHQGAEVVAALGGGRLVFQNDGGGFVQPVGAGAAVVARGDRVRFSALGPEGGGEPQVTQFMRDHAGVQRGLGLGVGDLGQGAGDDFLGLGRAHVLGGGETARALFDAAARRLVERPWRGPGQDVREARGVQSGPLGQGRGRDDDIGGDVAVEAGAEAGFARASIARQPFRFRWRSGQGDAVIRRRATEIGRSTQGAGAHRIGDRGGSDRGQQQDEGEHGRLRRWEDRLVGVRIAFMSAAGACRRRSDTREIQGGRRKGGAWTRRPTF